MMKQLKCAAQFCALPLLLAACGDGDDPPDLPQEDSGMMDAGAWDAGPLDARAHEAGGNV